MGSMLSFDQYKKKIINQGKFYTVDLEGRNLKYSPLVRVLSVLMSVAMSVSPPPSSIVRLLPCNTLRCFHLALLSAGRQSPWQPAEWERDAAFQFLRRSYSPAPTHRPTPIFLRPFTARHAGPAKRWVQPQDPPAMLYFFRKDGRTGGVGKGLGCCH